MSQSLSQLFVHAVWHTKIKSPLIKDEDILRLCQYIAALFQRRSCGPIVVNGTSNHINALFCLSKNRSLSSVICGIKTESSKWLKEISPDYREFGWQNGYGAFSVSRSMKDLVANYIRNQQKHHEKRSAHEEYVLLLKKHGVEYDETYLLTD